jgi:hypothetical protein
VENVDVIRNSVCFCVAQYIDPLPALLVKEEMTDEEVVQCKQVIYSLINLETKHAPLQMPNMGQRGKGPKRYVETRSSFATLFLETYP